MRYGYIVPYGDARSVSELAVIAEDHDWDGIFCWDPVWGMDVWVLLTAAAMRTERIRLGTMLTPVPRKRPWDLAGQTAAVDNLSGGRVILATGLGVTGEDRWWMFEDDPGRQIRAEMLDEGLAMLQQLWAGEPFDFDGRHFRSRRLVDQVVPPPGPPPVQQPRIPIWVVGAWPRMRSMRRAARLDGLLPSYLPAGTARVGVENDRGLTPEILSESIDWVRQERRSAGLPVESYDVVMEGFTPADDQRAAAEMVRPWAAAGATWWLESDWQAVDRAGFDIAAIRELSERRLRAGPPRP